MINYSVLQINYNKRINVIFTNKKTNNMKQSEKTFHALKDKFINAFEQNNGYKPHLVMFISNKVCIQYAKIDNLKRVSMSTFELLVNQEVKEAS